MKIRMPRILAIVVALCGYAPSAFAYLDPSTGSMILSAIVGLFATAGLALKTYWYRFKALFRKDDDENDAAEDTPRAEPE